MSCLDLRDQHFIVQAVWASFGYLSSVRLLTQPVQFELSPPVGKDLPSPGQPALKKLRKRFDYEEYGGAPLLGLKGNCIVAHGRAKRNAIRHAIRVAAEEVHNDVVGKISELAGTHLVETPATP